MGLVALMFWLGTGAKGKDAAAVSSPLKSEYALTSDPYLPGPKARMSLLRDGPSIRLRLRNLEPKHR
jgi:hypothetical protein